MYKSRILFVISILLLLVGCAKEDDAASKEPVRLWNGLYSNENQWYMDWRIAETEEGFYITVNEYAGAVTLIYFDKATRTAHPLCSAPECDHNNPDCAAWMRDYMPQVYYYEGKLYLMSFDEEATYLERMNPDGSNRERVRTMANVANQYWELIMHEDYFYYISQGKLCALPFSGKVGEHTILYEFPEVYSLNRLFVKGDYLYFGYAYLTDEEQSQGDSVAYRYHIPTGQIEELLHLEQGSYVEIAPVTDDDIYYYEVDRGFCCLHPSTMNSELIWEETGRVGVDVWCGVTNMFLANWRERQLENVQEEFVRLTQDGAVVDRQKIPNVSSAMTAFLDAHFGGSDEFQFFWASGELFYMDMTAEELRWESTGLKQIQ